MPGVQSGDVHHGIAHWSSCVKNQIGEVLKLFPLACIIREWTASGVLEGEIAAKRLASA